MHQITRLHFSRTQMITFWVLLCAMLVLPSQRVGAEEPADTTAVVAPAEATALRFSTYLGGSGFDYGRAVAADGAGNLYIVGDFFSHDFLGASTPTSGSKDVMLLKLDPAGNFVYGSYDGGPGNDEGLAVAVSNAGEAYVLIDPDANYPLFRPAIGTPPAVGDGILAKYDAAGNLVYSTYIGFGVSASNSGRAIAIGANGAVYVTGESYYAEERMREIAVAAFDSKTGQALGRFPVKWSFPNSHGAALAIGSDGGVAVTGKAYSVLGDWPTTSDALQPICGRKLALGPDRDCDEDAFVLVLNPDLSVRYSSYLGAQGVDEGRGIAIDGTGAIVVAGNTFSSDFPMVRPIQPSCPIEPITGDCSYDTFVSRLVPGSGLSYSTYLTSSDPTARTFVSGVAVDGAGMAYVLGYSNGAGLPMRAPLQNSLSTGLCLTMPERFCFDTFVTALAPDGSLRFGSYLGGTHDEYGGGIVVDNSGIVSVVGRTESRNFPVSAGAIQPQRVLGADFFVTRFAADGSAPRPQPRLPNPIFVPFVQR